MRRRLYGMMALAACVVSHADAKSLSPAAEPALTLSKTDIKNRETKFKMDGSPFLVSLPENARPIHMFSAGNDTSDGQSIMFTIPRMGIAPLAGSAPSVMPQSVPTMQEDLPRIIFESCVRSKLNQGGELSSVFQICHKANPDYDPPPIPTWAGQTGTSLKEATSSAQISAPAPQSQPPVPATGSSKMAASGWADASSGPSSPDSECDVSRDPSVLLSPACLKQNEDLLSGGMEEAAGNAGNSVLHAPGMPLPQNTGRHSLLANIPVRPLPTGVDDFSSSVGRPPVHSLNTSRSDKRSPSGPVKCDWAISGASFATVQYGETRSSSVKACIRNALDASNIDNGTIGITLQDIDHGIGRTIVECHRRNGQDTCGVVT